MSGAPRPFGAVGGDGAGVCANLRRLLVVGANTCLRVCEHTTFVDTIVYHLNAIGRETDISAATIRKSPRLYSTGHSGDLA